jgi:RimJ/RimL family protein N-acetyltransferase
MAMIDARDGSLVGGCGLNQIEWQNRRANLGYWVRRSALGKGYACQATQLLVDLGLGDLGLNRVEIVVAVENRASQKVAEKAGAHREGVARKRLLLHGVAHDAVVYSFTALPA